jgi:hypothetical protein
LIFHLLENIAIQKIEYCLKAFTVIPKLPIQMGIMGLLMVTLLNAWAEDCPSEAPRHDPHAITGETCPYIGKMGNYKLAIPRYYIVGPDFVYEGEDIWKPDKFHLHKVQSFSLLIEYFSIRVRISDFKGIETKADFDEYNESNLNIKSLPPMDKQWISMTIRAATKSLNQNDIKKRTLIGFLDSTKKNITKAGNFALVRQKAKEAGLDHYLSEMPPSHDMGHINELYFDPASERTAITCLNVIQVGTNLPLSFCNHYFISIEDNITVDIGGIRDKTYYISRWPEVEKGILKVFHSFIVQ